MIKTALSSVLLFGAGIEGEAEAQGVKVTDAEVKKSFDTQKKQSFPKAADYKKFLQTSGQTEPQLLERIKVELLSNKIRTRSSRARTPSPTPRSPTSTTRTRPVSRSPRSATCASS